MLLYQFAVSRDIPAAAYMEEDVSEADVMLRIDSDIQESTNQALEYLENRGWKVIGVRHAQSAETIDEFNDSRRFRELYNIAARDGIACAIAGNRVSHEVAASY